MPLKNSSYCIFLYIAILLLSGCSVLTQKSAPELVLKSKKALNKAWLDHKKIIASIHNWNLEGRAGIHTKSRSGSAHLNWTQKHKDFDISLSGPLGTSVFRLTHSENNNILYLPKHKPIKNQSSQILLYDYLGVNIPVKSVFYWVLGIPNPTVPKKIILNSQGRLEILHQNNWEIRFKNYIICDIYIVPSKVILKNENTEVTLALIWKDIS